jgi:hypothetical protein
MNNFDPTKITLPTTGTGLVNINDPKLKIGSIIVSVLPYVFGIAAILLLIYLVTAGLSMMLSRGDPKAMQGAQAKITNALIGFVIVIVAFFIVQLLGRILGLQTNFIFSQIFGIK